MKTKEVKVKEAKEILTTDLRLQEIDNQISKGIVKLCKASTLTKAGQESYNGDLDGVEYSDLFEITRDIISIATDFLEEARTELSNICKQS